MVRLSEWSFLTNHARVLVCITQDCAVRLRDIAATLGISERSASSILRDLADAGYVVKDKDGRRNRYRVQTDLPLPEAVARQVTIGEMLELLGGSTTQERIRHLPTDRERRSAARQPDRFKPGAETETSATV